MNKSEIIERLKNIAGYAVHTVGEEPFVMSLDDGIAVYEAIELLEKPEVIRCKDCDWWTKQPDSAQGRCALLGMYPTGAWYCARRMKRSSRRRWPTKREVKQMGRLIDADAFKERIMKDLEEQRPNIESATLLKICEKVAELTCKEIDKMPTAKALGKDTNVPSNSALDHIHNVVRDDAYHRGYEQGKAKAIPMEWIGEYLVWLKGIGGYGLSDARAIQSMIIKWKMDNAQKYSGCGPDYCEL